MEFNRGDPYDIPPHEIRLYYTCTDNLADTTLTDRYRERLSRTEARALGRMRSETRRTEFIVSRVLARQVLSRCCRIPPGAVRFEVNAHGKPELVPGLSDLPVRFNISHTRGLVAMAVTLGADIGLDVEDRNRRINLRLASRFFSAGEIDQLERAADDERPALFLEFWTLKEAFVKARGRGLAFGLDTFGFEFDGDVPRIAGTAGEYGGKTGWQFVKFDLLSRYTVAICRASVVEKRPVVTTHACVPFAAARRIGQPEKGQIRSITHDKE